MYISNLWLLNQIDSEDGDGEDLRNACFCLNICKKFLEHIIFIKIIKFA
jgi:hypothetical protein